MPLEQYQHQLYLQLWEKLYGSVGLQVGYDIWCDLSNKLWVELREETLVYILREELRHQCYYP